MKIMKRNFGLTLLLAASLFFLFLTQTHAAVMYGVSVGGNSDMPGNDYEQLKIYELKECVKRCAQDARCMAFSYDPRIFSCKLKDAVPASVRAPRIKSGRKLNPQPYQDQSVENDVVLEILYETRDTGKSYRSFKTKGFLKCSRVCKDDPKCKVFTYNEKKKKCHLKKKKSVFEAKSGRVSGVKKY